MDYDSLPLHIGPHAACGHYGPHVHDRDAASTLVLDATPTTHRSHHDGCDEARCPLAPESRA